MCMTGSDLCSSQKPWENQESTAKVIYDEFYEQVFIEQNIIDIVICIEIANVRQTYSKQMFI